MDHIRPAEGYAHRDVAKLKAIKSNDPQDPGLCKKGYVIGTKLPNEVPLVTDGSSYVDYIVSSKNRFFFSPISSSNGFSLLIKLSKSKATGLDNIPAKLIRECADLISIP